MAKVKAKKQPVGKLNKPHRKPHFNSKRVKAASKVPARVKNAIESHPQFREIVSMILEKGYGPAEVSKRVDPPVRPCDIGRFIRTKLARYAVASVALGEVAKSVSIRELASKTADIILGDFFHERILFKTERMDKAFNEAAKDRDWRGVAAIDKADTDGLMVFARLTKRIQDGSNHAHVEAENVVISMPLPPEDYAPRKVVVQQGEHKRARLTGASTPSGSGDVREIGQDAEISCQRDTGPDAQQENVQPSRTQVEETGTLR